MKRLHALVYFVSAFTIVNAGPHSLFAFATYIMGKTQFPEFSIVVMFDDVQVGYYYSDESKKIHYRLSNTTDHSLIEQLVANNIFQSLYKRMRHRASQVRDIFNSTKEINVYQRLAGCESETSGQLKLWDAFDGLVVREHRYYTQQNNTYTYLDRLGWDNYRQSHYNLRYSLFYHPLCVNALESYLDVEKNNVMRRVKPRVRLLKKTLTDLGKVQVTCLATGFYPRHINLTILRDGQPVSEDLVTGGILLPNVDGTYQMRESLEVNAEELKESCYSCSATRLSLDNKLDISLGPGCHFGPPVVAIVAIVSVVILVCVIAVVLAIIKCRRCSGCRSLLQSKYTAASSTEEQETPEDSTSSTLSVSNDNTTVS